ncbi:hypothetical protein HYH03_009280 [Edaphochlamys debaryana]|uniref:Uncharacterized protein n=1 Tax=Edaphochlamys debaryana TaxID=47281 RepID=A0A835XZ06_9CHLO|nr:hypothetical protein HYH03_009280 [Edaphochlamys debaryana]|eukprot:KAG2492329.1 hypothetical protein HYH03_009280 [Edaphochlamys debaryana]
MAHTRAQLERLVAQAFGDWLEQQRGPDLLPLQQLFALCHAGVVQRSQVQSAVANIPPNASAAPTPSLGGALVRLLDGCLAAAAALPDPQQRRRAASNVIAAFSRAALREAALRSGVHLGVPGGCGSGGSGGVRDGRDPALAVGGWGEAGAAARPALDRPFLDASFALLSAVAARYPGLMGELQLLQVAWGEAGAVAGAAQAAMPGGPSAVAETEGAGPRTAAEKATPPSWGSACSSPDLLAEFLLGPELQTRIAAGLLLFGGPQPNVTGSAGGCGEGPSEEALALAETPALLELCAAAAVADAWPGLVSCVAEAGPGALAARLASGGAWVEAEGAGEQVAVSRACCDRLAEALRWRPAAVLAAVPPPLLLVLASRDEAVRGALLAALQELLRPTQCTGQVGDDEVDTGKGVESWQGAGEREKAGGSPAAKAAGKRRGQLEESSEARERARVRLAALHEVFGVVGLDLGMLLQGHLAQTRALW